jgi:hypothetical protein
MVSTKALGIALLALFTPLYASPVPGPQSMDQLAQASMDQIKQSMVQGQMAMMAKQAEQIAKAMRGWS